MLEKCDTKILPYRNTIKKTKTFKLDENKKYKQYIDIKPNGLWYQINNCGSRWGELEDYNWGYHIYEVKLHTKCMCIIKNYKELLAFYKKYKKVMDIDPPKKDLFHFINWFEVSKKYCGFEIKNFESIKNIILKKKNKMTRTNPKFYLNWFDSFDFSSGCIWDLKHIKSIKYYKKYKYKKRKTKKKKK